MGNIRAHEYDCRPFSNFHGFVRLILLIDWDPIGILGEPRAMDEYDSYALSLCGKILSGADRDTIVAYLDKIEKERMGLRGNHLAAELVADKLLMVYRTIQESAHRGSEFEEGESN